MSDDTPAPMALDTPVPPVLAAAVVAAWAELTNLTKTKTANAGTYSYDYSDLADLVEAARPVLARHGLAMIQPTTRNLDGPVVVETWLLHESGNMLRWRFELAGTGSPQVIGSGITYVRRYCGQAALGMASEGQDDDGKAAATQPVTPPRHTRPQAHVPEDDTTRRRKHAMTLFGRLGLGDRDDRLQVTSAILGRQVESWADTSPVEQHRVIDELLARLDEESEADGRAAQLDVEADSE